MSSQPVRPDVKATRMSFRSFLPLARSGLLSPITSTIFLSFMRLGLRLPPAALEIHQVSAAEPLRNRIWVWKLSVGWYEPLFTIDNTLLGQ